MRFLGFVIAGVIAIAYYFVWPGRNRPDLVKARPSWSRIVLRWFHSLTWALLAAACLFWSKVLALLAAALYLIFLFTLARERSSEAVSRTLK